MRRAAILLALALTTSAAFAHRPSRALTAAVATPTPAAAIPLPPRGHLATRARELHGPRVIAPVRTHGRELTMYGDADARPRLLVAGCANGVRCAGTDVVNAATVGCPPPDAELWLFASLDPDNFDLDATPGHPGAAAWRQAVADLRPRTAIVFRSGPRAVVRAAGANTSEARRFARLANLPFSAETGPGLASWTAEVLPGTSAFIVELPGTRVPARRAVELAYAIDRLAGTRFARGALSDRTRMIRFGLDPRRSRN